jgi:ankyrin repeat protein
VLEGHEGHTQDITNYLQSELKIGDSHIARKIRGEVQNKASGVFMWVVLVVDILKLEYGRGRIHALERRLQEIPAGLHDLFQSILRRDSRNKEDLILCIQWVLFAKQPLSPEQLYFAILSGTDPATVSHWDSDVITEDTVKHFILDASKGLTEITKSKSPRVQFIHESVRDFLLKDDGLRSIWPDLGNNFEGQSHECLKRCCLISMSSNTVNHLEVPGSLATASPQDVINARALVSRAFPFLEYATQNVLYHADTAEGAGISQKDFIENFPLDRWVELDNLFEKHKIRRHTDSVNMLYILAERNMSNLIRSYACVRSCFEVGDERYGAPFLAAMATRSQKAVRAFVETLHKDEVQEDAAPKMYAHYCQDKAGRSFLGRDFKYPRHKNMIHFLLDLGNQDVLALAVSTGRVDVNAKSSGGSTPLILAVRYGHKDTVELLLRTSKVDVNAKNNAGLTPLMLAAQNGHKDTVKLLLGTGKADVGAKHDDGWTPLMLAAANGHKDTVKLLLSVDGIDIEAKHINGSTPLMFAAGNGHKDTVELLLGTGKVDVDAKHNKGLTALMRAAANGHKDIVELLHSTGKADPDTEDIHGLTPLMWAERNGHEDTVELLRSVKLNWQALNEG